MDAKALHKLSYGMYIVGSQLGERLNGQVANTVFQLTSEPPVIAVSLNKQNLTLEFVQASRVMAVSVLSTGADLRLIGDFGFKSGRDFDKFAGRKFKTGITGAPILLESAVAYLEAEVTDFVDVGTHVLCVGRVVAAELLSEEEPMTYAFYHQVKRGQAPKTAPTFVKSEEKGTMKMPAKYVCTLCGYVYDPAQGDPDAGIAPGTPFEALPEDWVCPVCGATKDQFEKEA